MEHPYLFFSASDAEAFKKRIATDQTARSLYEKATEKTEELLAEPFVTWEDANGGNSQHANFGRLNQQANRLYTALGTKLLIEGDARCADRLRDFLDRLIGFERWYGASYAERKPNPWHSDLCSTGTALATARIFDLLHPHLTPEERRRLARGIFQKGVKPALSDWALPETRIHALESMGHNWWAVCIGEAAAALLALTDDLPEEDCRRMLELADNALAAFLTYGGNRLFNKPGNFDDRGMFYEGMAYDNYGVGTLLRYLWCSERYFGRNLKLRGALPEGLCEAPLNFLYPCTADGKQTYLSLDFCDSDLQNMPETVAKYAVRLGLDTAPVRAVAAGLTADLWETISGFEPPAAEGSLETLPKTAVFSSGYALARDTWAPDGTLLAVRSGLCWNHAHNDAGSFVIFHRGKPFFTDGGTCGYTDPLYHAFYCQDAAHSVLRVGDKGQRVEELYRGTRFSGAIDDFCDTGALTYIRADATGPMAHLCSRLYRNFFWIENRLLVIADDVFCHEPETAQLSFHYDGTCRIEADGIRFENGGSTAWLRAYAPATPTEKHGHPPEKPAEDKPYLELRYEEKKRTHILFHTLALDPEENPFSIEPLSCENALGLRILRGDTEYEIWYNLLADGHVMHDNSQTVIAGFDTDAYMLAITRAPKADSEWALAVCASFLRRDGEVYLSSFGKKTEEVVTVSPF